MKNKSIIKYAGLAIILYLLYLGNVEVQTYFGEKALESTGLHSTLFKDAMAQSTATGKPVLVELSAIWCPSCRKLDKKVLSDKRVTDLISKQFIFSRLEYESEEAEQFMERYQVSGFPTLLIFQPKKSTPEQVQLTFEPEPFIKQLHEVAGI